MSCNQVNRRPNERSSSDRVRLLFLGMPCHFSYAPLAALVRAGLDVAAVAIPTPAPAARARLAPIPRVLRRRARPIDAPLPWQCLPPPELPVWGAADERSIVHLAWQRSIPVLAVGHLGDPSTLAAMASYQPEIIAVACFPWRLPQALLAVPKLGCLNVHPSLLPANRGPEPLFWTFYNGELATGVTVHLMNEQLDGGAILSQQEVAVPEGIAGRELERRCSELGGGLLVEAARALAAGIALPVPQQEAESSYFPRPRAEHLLVTPDRPARWAFSFIRGVVDLGFPIALDVSGQQFPIAAALAYDPDGPLSTPFTRTGDELSVQMNPGVLRLRLRQ